MKLPSVRQLFAKSTVVKSARRIYSHWAAGISANRALRNHGNPGPNYANLGYLEYTRGQVRDAVRNAPLAHRAVEVNVTNIVGAGIAPRFVDPELRRLWLRWEDECDASGLYDFYGFQEAAVRAWQEGGEAFVRIRPRRLEDGLSVPFQIELLESEMMPIVDIINPDNRNRVVQGVEFNGIGKRVAYWFYRAHPSDGFTTSRALNDLVRVPAEYVCHLYDPLRPGQVRGFPPMATVLQRIKQMNDFDEATIERQKQAAHITMVITRPAPERAGYDPVTGEAIEGREQSEIAPGSAYTLLPGEGMESPNLPSVGGEYAAFCKVQGQAIAAGFGIPYELLTGDFGGLSDRTARVIINEYRRRVEQHQWNRVVRQLCRPIKDHFIENAKLSGVRISDEGVRWIPPVWPYFHPVQDVQALTAEVKAGFRSQSDVIYSRGNDPEQVRRERAEEQKADKESGITSATTEAFE